MTKCKTRTISLKRVPPSPVSSWSDPNGDQFPHMVIARVELEIMDEFTPENWPGIEWNLITRLLMTDDSETLQSYERRARQQLAQQLRTAADALDVTSE